MLTLDNPEILAQVRLLSAGLLTAVVDDKRVLIVKAHKEALLAARENGGFKIYVAPLPTTSGLTIGLVTAIFDDHDEPLTIRTPLFGEDPFLDEMLEVLHSAEIDIYFFDEHAREWMSYRCSLEDKGSVLKSGKEVVFPTYESSICLAVLDGLEHWFSYRTTEDDDASISVTLKDELWPSDIIILDHREENNDYWGSDGFATQSLTTDKNPGYFQERDIAAGFRKVLDPNQIVLNAYRTDEDLEFTDVIAGTENALILVQAKDSPNTGQSLSRTLARKIKTSESQVEAALKQMTGALNYARRNEPIPLRLKDEKIEIHKNDRRIINLVIVKELFPIQGGVLSAEVKRWHQQGNVLIILDYPAFHNFIHQFGREDVLIDALEGYASALLESEAWVSPKKYVINRILELRKKMGLDD